MNVYRIIVWGGVALILLQSFIMKLPSTKKRFQKMDDRKLIELKVNAEMMIKSIVLALIFVPLLFIFIISMLNIPANEYFTCFLILTVMLLSCVIVTYRNIIKITKAELECREFKKETEKRKP